MSTTILFTEPESIVAGDTALWNKELRDYPPSDGWALTYYFAPSTGGTPISFSSPTNTGAFFSMTITATQTAAMSSGIWNGQGKVSLLGEIHTVWQDIVFVRPGIVPPNDGGDLRSKAKIILDNIEAVLTKTATREVLRSEIAGVTLERYPIEQLVKLRDRFRTIVSKEEAFARVKARKASGRRILTHFINPNQGLTWPPGFIRT